MEKQMIFFDLYSSQRKKPTGFYTNRFFKNQKSSIPKYVTVLSPFMYFKFAVSASLATLIPKPSKEGNSISECLHFAEGYVQFLHRLHPSFDKMRKDCICGFIAAYKRSHKFLKALCPLIIPS